MADAEIAPLKVCSKCGAQKPADREHFPPVGKGLRPRCRPCWREHEREYFWANREAKRAIKKRQWAKTNKAEARARIKAWKESNPEKARAIEVRRLARIKGSGELKAKAAKRMREWRAANPERVRNRRRELYQNPETARKAREATKRWREANIETARARDREYRAANPHYVIAHSEKRRARLLQAEGEFTGHDVIVLIKQFGRVCYYCRAKLKKFQVDHFIPLSRGGSNWPSNLVISCRPCNLSKGAKMPWEWQPNRFSEGQRPR